MPTNSSAVEQDSSVKEKNSSSIVSTEETEETQFNKPVRAKGITLFKTLVNKKKREAKTKQSNKSTEFKKTRVKHSKKQDEEISETLLFEQSDIENYSDNDIKLAKQEMPSVYNTFFSEISKYPLLTPEQEQDLARKIREDHDQEAFNLFVMSNLRLALACVREVMRRMGDNTILDFMDLAQESVLGLMTAVERFDYRKGTRFSTYGIFWIYQRVKRAIVSQRKGLSVPGFAGESVFSMSEYINMYNKGDIEEIPKKYRNRVRDLSRLTTHMMSFGSFDADDDAGKTRNCLDIERFKTTETEFSFEDKSTNSFFLHDFHKFLDSELNEYEADILRRKFGLKPYNIPASYKEIGKVYDRSSETIRMNIDGILKRLNKNINAKQFMNSWLK